MKEVLKVIQVRFEKAKEEVNTDLAVFAGDLVSVMEKYADSHPEWKETLEDLLILARSCSVMTPGELWLQCEGIVQDLDDQRQELPMGVLKKLYTRMLFILTRCTRLLQFHKESGFAEDEIVMDQRDKIIQSADNKILTQSGPHATTSRSSKSDARKSYSQEQHNLKWRRSQEIKPVKILLPLDTDIKKEVESPTRERISSWKPFPSPVPKPPTSFPCLPPQPNNLPPLTDGDDELPSSPTTPLHHLHLHLLRPPTSLSFPPPLQATTTSSRRGFYFRLGPCLPFLAQPPLPKRCRTLAALLRATASISSRLAREVVKITGYVTDILCSSVLDVTVFLGQCLGWK